MGTFNIEKLVAEIKLGQVSLSGSKSFKGIESIQNLINNIIDTGGQNDLLKLFEGHTEEAITNTELANLISEVTGY